MSYASRRVRTPGRRGRDDVLLAGDRQGRVRVAALRRDHPAPDVHRRAVREGLRRVGVLDAGRVEHLAGERDGQLDDVRRAASREDLDLICTSSALPAVRPSGVDMSV
ncbi:hypothetical protein STANM309S_05003 [Streptomyces tanashiensis]